MEKGLDFKQLKEVKRFLELVDVAQQIRELWTAEQENEEEGYQLKPNETFTWQARYKEVNLRK